MSENKQPWYEIGRSVREATSMEKAMIDGGLDFEVQKTQVYMPTVPSTEEGGGASIGAELKVLSPVSGDSYIEEGMVPVLSAFATRRVDTGFPLGVVGGRYEVIQNVHAFNLFDPLVADGSLRLDVAGCLGEHGEKIWVLAEIGDPVLLVEGDELKRYVLLLNSHDGTTALRVINTPLSTARGTTHTANVKDHSLVIRHTQSAGDRLSKARNIIARSLTFYENYVEAAHSLIVKHLSALDVKRFIESFFTAKIIDGQPVFSTRSLNQMAIIKQLFEGEEVTSVRGTAWSLYNALVDFVDNHRNPTGNMAQKHRRLTSISIGSGADMKQRAFSILSKP